MNKTKAFSKQNILFLVIAILNLAVCTLLTLTLVPGQIPMHIDFHEKISSLGSKWWLSINIVLPLILVILAMTFHKKEYLSFFCKALFVFAIYENLLIYSCLTLATDLSIGTLFEVPAAASVFMPFAVFIAVLAVKIKNIPYKSSFIGIRTKYTKANEFIWKQTHFFARDVFFATGVILFFVFVPFMFVRLLYIPLALLVVAITTDIVIINQQSKKMYKKFIDMQARQERVKAAEEAKKNAEKEPSKNEDKNNKKSEEKSTKNNKKQKKIRG